MLKLFVELVGTFIFFTIILKVGKALPIAVALAAVIYFGGDISGGHFNPGVTAMQFMKGTMDSTTVVQYIAMQLLAAYGAVNFVSATQNQ